MTTENGYRNGSCECTLAICHVRAAYLHGAVKTCDQFSANKRLYVIRVYILIDDKMTTEEKFNAAVNVIRSLPKNGSYQPSTDLMLRFYAYYKQATEGPAEQSSISKPAFWDVIGRTKYSSWAKLGNMSKSEAMERYVEELHRIVETMSYTDNVANFLSADDAAALSNMPLDDLQLISPSAVERVRSKPGSPYASRPSSPEDSRAQSPVPESHSHHINQQDSDDEYIDTVEHAVEPQTQKKATPNGNISVAHTIPNGVIKDIHTWRSISTEIDSEIARTVKSLQNDLQVLGSRVTALERPKKPMLVSFANLKPALVLFLIVWPFIAIRLTRLYNIRK